ncbi:hypothetical protein B5K05_32875 [Rhizobium phaseoli]|nr:hypothetical protein RPHASCH2410_PA00550 [Rhizobium phaseoli Ch24-10]RDJ01286.1 hypothetical protein B5K05_32875 [Rhizobium phaseoli]RDJ01768.1 hypothetical protein B5K04_30455 [Rhizobium phaseoli]
MAIASFKVVLQGRVQDFTIIIVAEIYRPPLINLLNPRRGLENDGDRCRTSTSDDPVGRQTKSIPKSNGFVG